MHETAGAGIPALAANPATADAAAPAEEALVAASRITTGIAAGVVLLGLAATFALPHAPAEAGGGEGEAPRARRRRREGEAQEQAPVQA